jgi:alkaline phosphatase
VNIKKKATIKRLMKASILGVPMLAFASMAQAEIDGYEYGTYGTHMAKNIIFMVPDGLGLAGVTATRIYKNGPDGDRLNMEKLSVIGYQRTHAANSTVTDSAAAGSAWATGQKHYNGKVSCLVDDGPHCPNSPLTILEIAKNMGKATGLVVTSQISHATPAAFGSHSISRQCGSEIARQFIEETKVDVILGGGVLGTKADFGCDGYPETYDWNQDHIVTLASNKGYSVVATEDELDTAVNASTGKILGLFRDYKDGKTPETFRVDPSVVYPNEEPTLPAMTEAAPNVLQEDADGFFLMVEGAQIDWRNHGNKIKGQIAEILAFDEAVENVMDWVNASPERKAILW